MNENLNILQCLIENRAFAPSHSALAQKLGYKGKMVIYRLMGGQTKDSTVDEVWSRAKDCFCLAEAGLYDLAYIFEETKRLADLAFPEMNRSHPEWVKQLVLAMVGDAYDYFSEKFRREVAPVLKDMKKDAPDVYWGIVTLLYIRGNAIDVYQGDVAQQAVRIKQVLAGWLRDWFPEKVGAHESGGNLLQLPHADNLAAILYQCILLFRHYAEADFKAQATQCLRLFPWGKRSYWRIPGIAYHGQGSEVWLLAEQDFGRATNGFYMALRLEAGTDIRTFELTDVLVFSFWTVDNEDDLPILQVSRLRGAQREWCFYVYGCDEEMRELQFEANPDTGNLFGLPDVLQRVNLEHPEGKDEKVWARMMKGWDEGQGESVFRQAQERLSDRVELKDDYRVVDVQISRTCLALLMERGDGTVNCQLPLDAYDFLSEINPSQRVMIVRQVDGEEVYVRWPDLGYEIRLSEFAQKRMS